MQKITERGEHVSTLLVIDNDAAARQIIAHHLTLKGFEVQTTASGAEGLGLAALIKPDIITLDIMTSEMDGFDFFDQLRHKPRCKDIPVVIITGKDLTTKERQRLDGRVVKIISKSGFAHKDLLDEIFHAVKTSLSEHEKKRVIIKT